jgi:hypothetical protein
MSYPIDRGFGYPQSPNPTSVEDLAEEMVRARTKFPGNRFLLAACMEELGELAQALVAKEPIGEIRNEAKQTACVAMRIFEEGDGSFNATDYDLAGTPGELFFTLLVAEVGQLARALLQRKQDSIPTCVGNIMRYANRISHEGDPMFANVADEHAKP